MAPNVKFRGNSYLGLSMSIEYNFSTNVNSLREKVHVVVFINIK